MADVERFSVLGRGLQSLIPPQDPLHDDKGFVSTGATQDAAHLMETEQATEGAAATQENIEPPIESQAAHVEARTIKPRQHHDESARMKEPVFHIEVLKIKKNPYQPRQVYDEEELNELANSIREYGILQPLVVTRVEHESFEGAQVEYELVAGERRLLAAKKIGLERVPAIVREQPREEREKLEMALVENIQRSNLNPLDTARAYAKLQDEFGLSQREIAQRLGKSREAVSNTIRLLQLPREIQKALAEGKINESHARILLQAKDYAAQIAVFSQILEHNLSVRAAQELVSGARVEDVSPREYPKDIIDPRLDSARRRLEETLGAQVKLVKKGQKGKITIKFYSEEELQNILYKFLGDGT